MQLFACASGGDIENAARLLRFAFAASSVDPLPGLAAIVSFELQRSDEKFGEIVRLLRLGDAALKPGEKLGLVVAAADVKIGNEDNFEFESLGFVDRHELDAAFAACGGIGQSEEFFKSSVEGWTGQILLAPG